MNIFAHQKPIASPFHAKSTAKEVAKGHDLSGKVAVVTGGYSGIGLETVKALVGQGCRVIVPARRPEVAAKALADMAGQVETLAMDLLDLASIHRAAADITGAHKKIDLLINNAGIMACPYAQSTGGFDSQFAANHLGHMALTLALMPVLQEAGARIVCLSSTAHHLSAIRFDDMKFEKSGYDKWLAYGQSKTANSLFAVGLMQNHDKDGIEAFAAHPGGIMTPLQRHLPTEEMIALGWLGPDGEMPAAIKARFKTPEQGASTTVFSALSQDLNGLGGVYLEDCNIAKITEDENPRYVDLSGHAVDLEAAAMLWDVSKKAIS